MATGFKTVTVNIPNTEGVFQTNQDISFGKKVKAADVAIKAFKLDYRERPPGPTDTVQVGASLENIGDETVEFKVKTNYTGAEYTGEVSILVIAELELL
jgi:hypothetical protein